MYNFDMRAEYPQNVIDLLEKRYKVKLNADLSKVEQGLDYILRLHAPQTSQTFYKFFRDHTTREELIAAGISVAALAQDFDTAIRAILSQRKYLEDLQKALHDNGRRTAERDCIRKYLGVTVDSVDQAYHWCPFPTMPMMASYRKVEDAFEDVCAILDYNPAQLPFDRVISEKIYRQAIQALHEQFPAPPEMDQTSLQWSAWFDEGYREYIQEWNELLENNLHAVLSRIPISALSYFGLKSRAYTALRMAGQRTLWHVYCEITSDHLQHIYLMGEDTKRNLLDTMAAAGIIERRNENASDETNRS